MANARLIQCHFWLSKEDYAFLQLRARERDEPVSALFRRVVRRLKQTEQTARAGNGVTLGESGVAVSDIPAPNYSRRANR